MTRNNLKRWGSLILLLLTVPSAQGAGPPKTENANAPTSENESCSVYMGPSSIPNAGWGVYAARSYRLGDRIGAPTIGIPVFENVRAMDSSSYGALAEFLWDTADIGGFGEANYSSMFLPGVGSLINHHAELDNVIPGGLTLDDEFYRHTNPMAGSFTSYHSFTFIAKRDIAAGEELFTDRTRNSQTHTHAFEGAAIPTEYAYVRVDNFVQELTKSGMNNSDAQWGNILYRLRTEILEESTKTGDHVLAKLLPKSRYEMDRVLKLGSARAQLKTPLVRDVEWLKEYGYCLDTIRQGQSSVKDAGRGAFATQAFAKGGIVASTPLVPITNMSSLEIGGNTTGSSSTSHSPKQLLLNYCYGHKAFDSLFCPTTNAAMINHHPEKANIGVRWARNEEQDVDYTLGNVSDVVSVDDGDLESFRTKLVMEYVALCDISPDEELFIDYGSEWASAMSEHMEHGHSPINESPRVSPKELNNRKQDLVESSDSFMEGYSHECMVYPQTKQPSTTDWEEFATNRMIDPSSWPSTFKAWYNGNDFAAWYPCEIVEVNNRQRLYKAEVFSKVIKGGTTLERRFLNVPRDRIRFANGHYHSDLHLAGSFRHYIPIPDTIFPIHWRKDYKKAREWRLGVLDHKQGTPSLAHDYEKSLRSVKCGIYLAESNIPDAGFGTYTAVDIPAGNIPIATLMPAVPAFYRFGNFSDTWPGKDYIWTGRGFDGDYEAYPDTEVTFLAGLFGALANAHTGITNLGIDSGVQDSILDRTKDPGAGGSSTYQKYSFRSLYPVDAGEELFVSYGESWFSFRGEFNEVPLKNNFNEADIILSVVWSLASQEDTGLDTASTTLLLKFIRENVIDKTEVRTRSALNVASDFDDLKQVFDRNGTAPATVQARSEEWLEENGYCQDHLYVKVSTVKQAGYGAFSRRNLLNGTVLISSPLIPTHRSMLNMSSHNLPTNDMQLLLNYHFGHKDSSLMFFPINQAIAINHNSARMPSGKEPNARVAFSPRDRRSRYFEQVSIEDLRKEKYSTMVLDIIATRDIKEDEEIFIDYGKDWESAWEKHVKEWRDPCKKKRDFMSSSSCFASSKLVQDMNKDKFNPSYFEWSEDHVPVCFYDSGLEKEAKELIHLVEKMPDSSDLAVNNRLALSYEGIKPDHEGFSLPSYSMGQFLGRACKILGANKVVGTFDVIFFFTGGLLVRHDKFPKESLRYRMRPYKSDLHAPEGFRHEIYIPDEVFPVLWKDLE